MSLNKFNRYKHDISLLEKKKKNISVFKLPIEFYDGNGICYLADENRNPEFSPILINYIALEKIIFSDNLILESFYIHEIGHALSQRKKNQIKQYTHSEYVPITLELLYSYMNAGEKGLSEGIKFRINESKNSPFSYESIVYNTYNISKLLGFQTIEKYIDFNNWQKKEMLSRLKDCLNCDIQVETFMEDYGIGFNDTESSVKSFRKTMERVGIK